MADHLPYDINNLNGAAVRALLAPISATLPTKPIDGFDQSSPYAANTPWFNVGATSGPAQVGRALTVAGLTIEQSQTVLLEEPTEVVYTVQIPFAELRPEILQIINDGGAIDTVSGDVLSGSGMRTPFGNIFDLTHYRVMLVTRKSKSQGIVVEPSRSRGRFLTFVGYDCTLSAENVQTNLGKGQLAAATVTFKLYPDSAVTAEGEEHGFWFDEDAQTLDPS